MNTVFVRPLQEGEAEALNALFRVVVLPLPYYNDAAKRTELAKHSIELLWNSVSVDPVTVLVANLDSQMIGFCLSKRDDDLIWLSWFGVHPDHRRKGVASELLGGLEEACRKENAHKIWCDCRVGNQASIGILSKHGYVPICTLRNHWYGQDYILWEKLIG